MVQTRFDSFLAKKLSTYLLLTPRELNALAELQSAKLTVKRGEQLIHQGQSEHQVFVLQVGWGSGYKDLPNGNRQIIWIPIPGDIVGLRSVLLAVCPNWAGVS